MTTGSAPLRVGNCWHVHLDARSTDACVTATIPEHKLIDAHLLNAVREDDPRCLRRVGGGTRRLPFKLRAQDLRTGLELARASAGVRQLVLRSKARWSWQGMRAFESCPRTGTEARWSTLSGLLPSSIIHPRAHRPSKQLGQPFKIDGSQPYP